MLAHFHALNCTGVHFRVSKLLESSSHEPKMTKKEVGFQRCGNVSELFEAVLMQLVVEEADQNWQDSQNSIHCFRHPPDMIVRAPQTALLLHGRACTIPGIPSSLNMRSNTLANRAFRKGFVIGLVKSFKDHCSYLVLRD